MAVKHAIGITINGNEVRAAFLSLVRGKARIKALESTTLDAAVDHEMAAEKIVPASLNDLENAFDIHDSDLREETQDDLSGSGVQDSNVAKVYALLDKFQEIKANVAINSPHLTVKYDLLDKEQVPNKKARKRRFREHLDFWSGDSEDDTRRTKYIEIHDKKVLKIDYEYHPASIDLIEEVNQFRSGNLNLVLMDTNELALVDLVREIYKFDKEEITAMVYIEQDFSRVIFLKGEEIYHISPIVHKGSMSDDVLEVIYSRMIFAQDHYFIPEINKILVAGHSSRLKAKYFFRQKFPSAMTGYLNSKKIQSDLRFKDRGLLFSRYAVPIALAWKALLKPAYKSQEKNLLPEYIVDRQSLPKLAGHGYVLLFLVTLTAFAFTWAVVAKNLQLRKVNRNIKHMQVQIDNNKSLTDRVQAFDDRIIELETKIALVDSFSKGYDDAMKFLFTLNREIKKIGDLWISDLSKKGKIVTIRGSAKRRDRIPILANAIGKASLKKVTRSKYLGKEVFEFHLEKNLDIPVDSNDLGQMTSRNLVEGQFHDQPASPALSGQRQNLRSQQGRRQSSPAAQTP